VPIPGGTAALPLPPQRVISKGKLSPRSLQLFEATGHGRLVRHIEELGINRWLPPLITNDKNKWLGDKSHLY
jgi:hypothetical protein